MHGLTWAVLPIMDNLIARGKAKPMIVVMTNGNANQAGAPNDVTDVTLQGDAMAAYQKLAGKFEAHLVKDLVPFIENNLKVITGKDNRAIAGLSMGGMQIRLSRRQSGMFSYVVYSSMGIMNFGPQNQDAAKRQEGKLRSRSTEKHGCKLYWIGVGKDDFLYQSVVKLSSTLDKHTLNILIAKAAEATHGTLEDIPVRVCT